MLGSRARARRWHYRAQRCCWGGCTCTAAAATCCCRFWFCCSCKKTLRMYEARHSGSTALFRSVHLHEPGLQPLPALLEDVVPDLGGVADEELDDEALEVSPLLQPQHRRPQERRARTGPRTCRGPRHQRAHVDLALPPPGTAAGTAARWGGTPAGSWAAPCRPGTRSCASAAACGSGNGPMARHEPRSGSTSTRAIHPPPLGPRVITPVYCRTGLFVPGHYSYQPCKLWAASQKCGRWRGTKHRLRIDNLSPTSARKKRRGNGPNNALPIRLLSTAIVPPRILF